MDTPAVSLMRTSDLVRRAASLVIEPHGITIQQYNVLRILRGAGSEGLPTLEIAARMIEQTPGITRLMDRLEAKKLVRRERCPRDRRQVTCRISEEGLALLAALDGPVAESERVALSGLTPHQLRQLITLLDRTRNGLHAALAARRAQNSEEAS
ncbi:MAG: MarR family winged helix-turn-helix transcriptional regulator [Thermoanaerobaculia bacterium]